MEGLKLLVVDDDLYTREGIAESINWKQKGISRIIQAQDGTSALQIARWFKPDIVITDIRMPKMDGITFAKKLRRIIPESQAMFITGYVEVEYLKGALDLSAVAFLEKPLNIDDLEAAVSKAVNQIREIRLQKIQTSNYNSLTSQRLAVMLNRGDGTDEDITALCRQLNFPMNRQYLCFAIRIPNLYSDTYSSSGLIAQTLNTLDIIVLTEPRENGLILLIAAFKSHDKEEVIQQICQVIEKNIPDASIGIGTVVNSLEGIPKSRKSSKTTLDLLYYENEIKVQYYKDNYIKTKIPDVEIYSEFKQVLSKHPEQLCEWAKNFLQTVARERYLPIEYVQSLICTLLVELFRRHAEIYGSFYGITQEEDIGDYIHTLTSFSETSHFFTEVVQAIDTKINNETIFSPIIKKTKNYIAKNYQNPLLSVSEIAEIVHLSSAYLNTIFKSEVKMTIKQYIIDYRIARACKLLESGNRRITEVAKLCGYSNANYFSKAFRETMGVAPNSYKDGSV